MYGMFHRGLKQQVFDELGALAWQHIETELGTGPRELVSLDVFDDDLTVAMMEAVARAMGLPFEQYLERLGEYWVRYVATGHYAQTVRFTGRTLREFLGNLDRLHLGVSTMLADARVPSFAVADQPDGLCVTYAASRAGLQHLVLGLLRGLLQHFGEEGDVTLLPGGDGPQRYRITLAARRQRDAA